MDPHLPRKRVVEATKARYEPKLQMEMKLYENKAEPQIPILSQKVGVKLHSLNLHTRI